MKNLSEFNNRIGFNKRKEWTDEDLAKVQAFQKEHYDKMSSTEKLENKLFAIKTKIEHYLMQPTITEKKMVGEFIKEGILAFKKIAGITQEKLAKYWGTTSPNLRKYIKGERRLSIDLAIKIGSTFDLEPDLLMDVEIKNQLLSPDYKGYKEKYSLGKLLPS